MTRKTKCPILHVVLNIILEFVSIFVHSANELVIPHVKYLIEFRLKHKCNDHNNINDT